MLLNILYDYDKKYNKSYLENIIKDNEHGIKIISKYLDTLDGKVIPPYVGHLTLISMISRLASNIYGCTNLLKQENLEDLELKLSIHILNEMTYRDFSHTWSLETVDEDAKYLCWQHYKVRCKNNGKIFDGTSEASEWCGLKTKQLISANIRGKNKSAGKDPVTGEKLTWEYVTEYESLLYTESW